jgi:hypothetical protein
MVSYCISNSINQLINKSINQSINHSIVDVNLLDGAVAWQSLSGGTSAEKAIDGVTTSYATITTSCFYQEEGNSYWAVEFGTAGLVKEVDLYLYSLNSCEYIYYSC